MTTRIILLVILFNALLISNSSASIGTYLHTDSTSTASVTKAKLMLMRLDVINASDQSDFTKSEKRIIRKEVRHIKGNLKELRGGRYVKTAVISFILLVPISIFYVAE
jgi:hypothetical protein